jgi:hypothetical protein
MEESQLDMDRESDRVIGDKKTVSCKQTTTATTQGVEQDATNQIKKTCLICRGCYALFFVLVSSNRFFILPALQAKSEEYRSKVSDLVARVKKTFSTYPWQALDNWWGVLHDESESLFQKL